VVNLREQADRMKPYCTVRYADCAYGPCGKVFVKHYRNASRTMCSNDCLVRAARERATPAEMARRGRMAVPRVGPREPFGPEKVCEGCGASYAPFHSAMRWCQTCAPDRAAKHRMKRYGVTQAQWDALRGRYAGACWLCRDRQATELDHSHAAGTVRGALCTRCNTRLGLLEEDAWIVVAREYLAAFA
jgi:hypothetical protein